MDLTSCNATSNGSDLASGITRQDRLHTAHPTKLTPCQRLPLSVSFTNTRRTLLLWENNALLGSVLTPSRGLFPLLRKWIIFCITAQSDVRVSDFLLRFNAVEHPQDQLVPVVIYIIATITNYFLPVSETQLIIFQSNCLEHFPVLWSFTKHHWLLKISKQQLRRIGDYDFFVC